MAFEQITIELDEGILTITLNRPERLNAWTATMGRELIEAFDQADADDDVRAIIVTGAGRGFCAGADLASGGETFDYRARAAEASLLSATESGVPLASWMPSDIAMTQRPSRSWTDLTSDRNLGVSKTRSGR